MRPTAESVRNPLDEVAGELRLYCAGRSQQTIRRENLAHFPVDVTISDIGALIPGRCGEAVKLQAILNWAFPGFIPSEITLKNTTENFSKTISYHQICQTAWLIHSLAGQPLPSEKGGPFRLLVPETKLCGTAELDNCVNVKGLDEIELLL